MRVLEIVQLLLGVFLIACILVQQRSTGFSGAFSAGELFQVQRRGAEKFLFRATAILSVLFFGFAVLQWYV